MIKNLESYNFLPSAAAVIAIAEAGLNAVRPQELLAREFSYNSASKRLRFGGKSYDVDGYDRVFLVGIGAGTSNAIDYLKSVLPGIATKIVIMDPEAEFNPEEGVFSVTYHPTANNAEATNQLLKYAPFSEDDLVIAITDHSANHIVNAGSSMPPDQQHAVLEALAELQATPEELLTVAIHLAEGRGGGMAQLLAPAQILNYIVTDRLDEAGTPIVSSPFLSHDSSLYEAKDIVERYNILAYCNLDSCVFIAAEIAPTTETVSTRLLASPLTWLEPMQRAAKDYGTTPEVFTAEDFEFRKNPVWREGENAMIALVPSRGNVKLHDTEPAGTELYLRSGMVKEAAGKLVLPGNHDPHAVIPEVTTFNVGAVGIKLS